MSRPLNDFTNVVLKELSQDYAAFRVFKHYVIYEADYWRMVQYIISREEAAEGTEIIRDSANPDKVSFRVYSRDRVLLLDWATDVDGFNLFDGNTYSEGLSTANWTISGEPDTNIYTDIEDAITRHLNWLQYEPA